MSRHYPYFGRCYGTYILSLVTSSQSLPAPPRPYLFYPPVSADRHSHLFNDTLAPRGNSFNPDFASGASWIKDLPKRNETVIEWYDYWYQQRLRALQSVDEMVGAIFEKLAEEDLLDNTYVRLGDDL